jgi:putative MATE family efflux protein
VTKDLTLGKPSKVIWMFCLPLFASVIFQQLYSIADSLVAGRMLEDGEAALAAIGNSYEITLVYLAFAFGCNMGFSVIVSRFFGQKAINKAKTSIYTALITTTITCVILMLIGLTLGEAILKLLKTPESLIQDSKLYLDIYTYGLLFVFIYKLCTGIFAAFGDSKTPFIFLAISSICNVGIEILFVKAFHMGIEGVAWATFICQGVSAILSFIIVIIRLKRLKPFDNDIDKVKPYDFRMLKVMLVIPIPSILQQSFVSIGNIAIQSAINSFGEATMAGYSAVIKLQNLVITGLTTLSNGISNYIAQNLGAGKKERIRPGFLAGFKLTLVLIIPFSILYFFLGGYIVQIFLEKKTSEEAISVANNFLHIIAPFYFLVATKLIADGVIRGYAKMGFFMIDTFLDLGLRVGLAFLFPYAFHMGSNGIWISWPIGWGLSMLLAIIFYIFVTKPKKEIILA